MSITGWALLFHPDLLHGFPIERHIGSYSFFDYRVNEALHMTDEEHDIMVSGIRQATISPVRHPACQERACFRRVRLTGIRPARLRIHPAFQPYVQKVRRYHSVGIPPTPPFPLSSLLKSMLQRERHSHIAFAQCSLQLCLRDIVYLSQAGKVPRVGVVIDDEVVPLVED